MLTDRIAPDGIFVKDFDSATIHCAQPSPLVEQALELLDRLVEINTYTRNINGINQAQNIFQEALKALGLEVERIRGIPGQSGDILLAKTIAAVQSNRFTLLLGHVDTVYPEHLLRPKAERSEGRYLAPGSVDMKAGLIVVVAALQALHEEGVLQELPIAIAINADEEIGSPYSKSFFESLAPSVSEALVFEGGRTHDVIVTARRGIAAHRVTVGGRSAHAGSNHKQGINAIAHAAQLILDIEALTDYERAITANVGVVSGGKTFNAVPDFAQLEFEVRCNLDNDFQTMVKKIAELEQIRKQVSGLTIQFEELACSPPMVETQKSRALAERFIAAGEAVGVTQKIHEGPVGGTSDANILSALKIPTIDGLGPYGSCAHNEAEEFFIIESLGPKILVLAQYLRTKS
ncbi:MAG: M20/M25/M40 family metallo-hydrolase [Bdellovibrionales bacterium]|nr:M20/M25/M40 family metallo-hydrolase [Bdellovibrionales bacterium]